MDITIYYTQEDGTIETIEGAERRDYAFAVDGTRVAFTITPGGRVIHCGDQKISIAYTRPHFGQQVGMAMFKVDNVAITVRCMRFEIPDADENKSPYDAVRFALEDNYGAAIGTGIATAGGVVEKIYRALSDDIDDGKRQLEGFQELLTYLTGEAVQVAVGNSNMGNSGYLTDERLTVLNEPGFIRVYEFETGNTLVFYTGLNDFPSPHTPGYRAYVTPPGGLNLTVSRNYRSCSLRQPHNGARLVIRDHLSNMEILVHNKRK